MSLASDLINQLNRAGATIEVVDGKPRVRGAKVPDVLMAELKANREVVVAEWERSQREDRARYGKVPPADAALLGGDAELTQAQRKEVQLYVVRQPRTVHAWVHTRADAYFGAGKSPSECDWRAALDVVCWQRNCGVQSAVKFIEEMADTVQNTVEHFKLK